MVDVSRPAGGGARADTRPRRGRPLARAVLIALMLVLAQAGTGMVVNLYARIPGRHPGARPASYFSGSVHSVAWALGHGTGSLALHAGLGLALVVVSAAVAIAGLRARRAVAVLGVLAALLVIGAGFNGASFLDFNRDFSSLIMALLALAALACYAGMLYLLPGPARREA